MTRKFVKRSIFFPPSHPVLQAWKRKLGGHRDIETPLSMTGEGQGRGDDLEWHQGRFRLHIRNIFLMKRVIRHQNGPPRVESSSLEVFKKQLDIALSAVGGVWSQVGCNDLRGFSG